MEKSSRGFCTTSVKLKKLPKDNNRPLGECSPNLVTLVGMWGAKLKSETGK
jgi:hypothetical protein